MKGCVLCGGSGWFPVKGRGKGAFADQEYEGVRECLCKRQGAPIVHEDSCNRCQGWGIYGGQIGTGQFDGPWRWCDCAAGRERQEREPNIIPEANAARERLIRGDHQQRIGKGLRPIGELLEPYHGLF